ncbi:MAG: hypothetical protein ACK40S_14755, partial [Burkholderiaceae bacterium]
IRPGLPQPLAQPPASPVGEAAQARSAQAAFFRAALNQAQAPQAQAPAAAVMSTVRSANPARPVEPPPAAPERETPRIMRPGTYLDIKV